MPRISPARTSKRQPAHDLVAAVVADAQVLDVEHRLAGCRFAAVDRQLNLAADHQLGQVLLARLGRQPLADHPAAPDHRDPVRYLEHLVELVADEDDAPAALGQAAQEEEDLLRLLRREHGRRFVEDEDARVAVESLQDLDALLLADRERADLDVRIDLEAEAL